MATVETRTRLLTPMARRPSWPPRMEAILDDWRKRWPAVFTKPVPLAIGVSRHIRMALQAEGKGIDRKTIGIIVHRWTMQSAYLRAVACGAMRRNLDGSEAGIPDDAARQYAQTMLQERAARQADKERQRQEKRAAREIAF